MEEKMRGVESNIFLASWHVTRLERYDWARERSAVREDRPMCYMYRNN
jgi:hypothetical protein